MADLSAVRVNDYDAYLGRVKEKPWLFGGLLTTAVPALSIHHLSVCSRVVVPEDGIGLALSAS
jgi:hypothetical protein